MARQWLLGEDLAASDNLLDEITFEELITTVRCNCREITPEAVTNELSSIVGMRCVDMLELLARNMDAIVNEAKKGRAGYEEDYQSV